MSNDIDVFSRRAIGGKSQEIAIESREVAEVQGRMVIAKRFPRDEERSIERILSACARPSLAEEALYSYQRGGAEITGPSIRLAEAMAQAWGNLEFGVRELDQARGESTVEAFCWDMETNTRQSKVFHVSHVRFSGGKSKPLTDPRDVYEVVANQAARRLRACILGIIPGDVREVAQARVEKTLAENTPVTPDVIKRLAEAFRAYGVTVPQIEALIGRDLNAINSPLLIRLKKIYQSIKDGISGPDDWFKADAGVEDLNARIDTETGEIRDDYPEQRAAIEACADMGAFTRLVADLPKAAKTALRESLRSKQRELGGSS